MGQDGASAGDAAPGAGETLPGLAAHAHARAVLAPALAPGGRPSHAYLFHGPPGTGKRQIALEFAAALLADDDADRQGALERARRGAHPDLTWVTRSGAAEMLVSDVEEPVVAAASRTPFQSARRVFVIEGAERMNDQAANRLLKTLEEPPPFAHLVLLSDRREDVLTTIASRCQLVRFDPPPAELLAQSLAAQVGGERALACARLAQGDARLARRLAGEEGERLRAGAEGYVRAAIAGDTERRPWLALLEAAREAAEMEGERSQQALAAELELVPARERRRHEREAAEARRRGERRARTQALDLALRLGELWLRDAMCVLEGAPELALAADRSPQLAQDAARLDAATLRRAVDVVAATRMSLALNVSEELALEALAYRLQALLAG